jgi:UDP-N-acetylmuramoyl-L-alanyl-D-glutamate--2,6-diaminopimelate ligase
MARWFVDRSPQHGIPSVSLRRVLRDAQFLGCRDLRVSGCSADSRRLDPGQVFVALRGDTHDGHDFVGRALERGAAAVVVERPCPEAGTLQVVVPDARLAHAQLCHALAGGPSDELSLIGVAGPAGRTVTAHFLRSIFEAAGARFGMVGEMGWSDGTRMTPPGAQEPGAAELAEILVAMLESGCEGGILEMSLESLARRSFDGMRLDAAVVLGAPGGPTSTREMARQSHARVFRMVSPGGSTVVNADDPEVEILGAVNLEAHRVAYGFVEGRAEVTAVLERRDDRGTRFRLRGFERELMVELRVVGPRTVSCALAAAAVAWARGLAATDVVAGLEAVSHVPGRLEPVHEGQSFDVWVDRARTALELSEVLGFLRTTCPGHIHLVLSADVPPDQRSGLARVAELQADRVTLSIDDPYCSDYDAVLDAILTGFQCPGRVRVEPDRRQAIETSLAVAVAGDAVLIAGGSRRALAMDYRRPVARDDRSLARMWLRQRFPEPRRRSA